MNASLESNTQREEAFSAFDFNAEQDVIPCPSLERTLTWEQYLLRQLAFAQKKLATIKSALAMSESDDRPKEARRDEPLTSLQRAIWEALDGRALAKLPLANEVCKGDSSRLYKKNGVREMMEMGLVKNKRGIGYYRPDAPPRHLCPHSSPN